MKKLIVVITTALMAVVVQASSVNWSFTAGSAYKDYTIYLCSELAEGGFTGTSDITSHLLGSSGNSGTLTGARSAAASGTATVANDPGSTVNFYYVIVSKDGDGYWTKASSGEAYTTASTHSDSAVLQADGTALLSSAKTAWATGGGGGGGIPEPTSGLLLLVGGAMLALRRKQK